MNIYRSNDYKDLIKTLIRNDSSGRGVITKLADAAQCQRSYLSQVLNSHVHLTPDQALGICGFFKLNDDETSYLLTLVDWARAGSPALKKRLKNVLEKLRKKNEDLETQIAIPIIRTDPSEVAYYSSWLWPAIHIAVSIPELQTKESLSRRLNVPESLVASALDGLAQMGLVKNIGLKWSYAQGERHLSKYSALISLNHSNWRQRAVLSSQTQFENSYHYTGVSTMSESDFIVIKELLLKMTQNIRKIISASKEEKLICLNLDFFNI